MPYSSWFVDCDATAECFGAYSPLHAATRIDDIHSRRRRLGWLESEKKWVVGSEGGSALFADVIHFGHGVHTPYIGHLDVAFRDRQSPHFLGRYWPPDAPEQFFKPVPIPRSLIVPYVDPRVRIPLYEAALGDEVIVSHHWSFDSFKLADVAAIRVLLEILYRVPPLYHLNRATWPERRERMVRHVAAHRDGTQKAADNARAIAYTSRASAQKKRRPGLRASRGVWRVEMWAALCQEGL